MCDARTIVLLLTVAAFILPTVAAVLAYRSASAAIVEADNAAAEYDRIYSESLAERAKLDRTDDAGKAVLQAAYAARYAAIGYPTPTYIGAASAPAYATSRAVHAALDGAKTNAWLALIGLACGLAASVWSLYLPAGAGSNG